MCVYIHIFIYVEKHAFLFLRNSLYIHKRDLHRKCNIHTYAYIYMYIYMYTHTHIYIYINTYTNIYTYTYIHTFICIKF